MIRRPALPRPSPLCVVVACGSLLLLAIIPDEATEIANWRPDSMKRTRPTPLPAAKSAQPAE